MKIELVPVWVKVLVICLIFGGFYSFGVHNGKQSVENDWLNEKIELSEKHREAEEAMRIEFAAERDRLSLVSGTLQELLLKSKGHTDVITRTLEVEVEKPVYRDCVLPPSGVQLISNAATRYNSIRSGKD